MSDFPIKPIKKSLSYSSILKKPRELNGMNSVYKKV